MRDDRRERMGDLATVVAFLAGLVMVAAGVALWSVPAGVVVGGVELIVAAVAYERGGTG